MYTTTKQHGFCLLKNFQVEMSLHVHRQKVQQALNFFPSVHWSFWKWHQLQHIPIRDCGDYMQLQVIGRL